MNLRNVFSRIGRAARGYGGISGATIALFIAILVVFNAAFYALAVRYSWYAYTQPSYEHEIGDVSRAFLGEFDGKGKEVKIRFCRAPDLIDADVAARLVHDTAKQLAARHDFITLEYINIYTDPGEVKKYLYEYNEKDELVETGYSVTTESVIIDGGDEYTVLGLSSFYHLSDSSAILAYNGEEIMLSMLRRVLTDSRETVYFTTNHGESSTMGFYNLLVCAGYRVEELNLTLGEIPDDAAMIVISNPGYDFEKAQAGSGIRAEIDKLGEYLDGGGRLFVLLDALAGELPHLDALLSEYGLLREHATVRDVSEAISYDGLTLLTRFASGETADAIASSIGRYTDGRVVLREATPIRFTESENGATPESLLVSAPGSAAYADGKQVSSSGSYTLAALSENAEGGGILLASSLYLTADDLLRADGYANREFLYAVLSETLGASVPLGSTTLAFENEQLQGLTMGVVHVWTVVLVLAVPLGVLIAGNVVRIRRKNR